MKVIQTWNVLAAPTHTKETNFNLNVESVFVTYSSFVLSFLSSVLLLFATFSVKRTNPLSATTTAFLFTLLFNLMFWRIVAPHIDDMT